MEENTSQPDNQSQVVTLESTLAELEKVKKESKDYLDGWRRARADYVNYKHEQEKRGGELAQFAGLAVMIQMIPVLENFRLAFVHIPQDVAVSEWAKGVQQIYKQLQDALKVIGVEEMPDPTDTQFDPNQHESVAQEVDISKPEGIILKVVNSGYLLHGKVISPAKVVVNALQEEKPI